MAMFANTYQDDRSPYASKRNTLETRKLTLPEPDLDLLSPTPVIDDEIAAAELRLARLNKIHNYVLPPAVRDAKQAWTVWSQGIAVT
ncbi:hypothetical protein FRC08_014175, partial [Ceratobasidium sp. 394]